MSGPAAGIKTQVGGFFMFVGETVWLIFPVIKT